MGDSNLENKIVYRVAIDKEYEPYEFVNDENKADGFTPALLKEIGKSADVTFEFIPLTWGHALESLENGDVDLINMIYSSEREQNYAFSLPHSQINQALFNTDKSKEIINLASLKDYTVGFQEYDISLSYFKNRDDFVKKIFHSKLDGLLNLNLGELDAFVCAQQAGINLITKYNLSNLHLAVGGLFPEKFAFATRKNNKELIDLLNTHLGIISNSGELKVLTERWLSRSLHTKTWIEKNQSLVLRTTGLMVLILMGLIYWNYALRLRVDIKTKSLQESEMSLRKSQEMALIGSWDLDIASGHLFWSDEVYRLFGFVPHEINPTYELFLERIHRDDLERVRNVFSNSISEGKETCEIEFRIRKNGTKDIRHIYEKCENIKDPSGKIVKSVGMIHDITDRKQAEQNIIMQNEKLVLAKQKAEESDLLKTEFIRNMSHEIRTPMNGIIGFSKILETPNLTPEKQKIYVNIIQNSGFQLMRIIDDLLEISELETKQVRTIEKSICLNDILMELFSIFDVKAKHNKIHLYLETSLQNEDSYCSTDVAKLNKVLSNLLENAVKYTKEGYVEFGYIVKEALEPPLIEFYVKDTGIGIKPENQEMIFERFSQEEKSLSESVGGLGLGLSIAKENAQLLGGDVRLESEKNKGSTFYVTIPFKKSKKETEDGIAPYKHHNAKKSNDTSTVLLVEDEEVNSLYLSILLENATPSLNILHAKNGKEAVEMCQSNPSIEIVFMDLKTPILNGYESTKMIKKFRPELPVIAQTAYSSKSDKEKAFSFGCDDFISKPISQNTIQTILNNYLIQD